MSQVAEIVQQARHQGWNLLPEADGYALLTAVGLPVPVSVQFDRPGDLTAEAVATLVGDRVVLKAVCPDLPHKSEVGGVAILPRRIDAIREAARQMLASLSDLPLSGFLLQEWIDYDHGFGNELLVSLQWDREFGPVLICGAGGIHAERLGQDLKANKGLAITSARFAATSLAEILIESTAVELLTTSRRGRPAPISLAVLANTLGTLARQAEPLLSAGIEEIEINPMVVRGHELLPLDILVRVSPERASPEAARPLEKLRCLLEPRSIAIVGVSRQLNPGRLILQNLLREGFDPQNVYVVKSGESQIEGCRCFAGVEALPERVDLLIVAVSAEQVPELMDEVMAERAAEGIIVIPGGLQEKPGTDQRVRRILDSLHQARKTEWKGPLINGGNCMGIRSAPGRYDTSFLPDYKVPPAGRQRALAALLAQSGAFLVAKGSKLSSISFKYSISIGNQLDLTVGDYLQYLSEDPDLRVIGVYVEGFKTLDGLRFLETAARLRDQGRIVVLYRAGRSAEGAQAAASHTASLAGSYVTTVGLARAAGVLVAESMTDFEELVDLAVRWTGRPVKGRRLAGFSNAGFECVAFSDHLGWLERAELSRATLDSLQDLLDRAGVAGLVDVKNPLDVTPMMGDELFERVADRLLADTGVDVGVVGCVPLTGALDTLPARPTHDEDLLGESSVASRLGQLWSKTVKPWVCVVDGGGQYDPLVERLRSAGVPTFRSMDRALEILEIYCRWALDSRPARQVDGAQG